MPVQSTSDGARALHSPKQSLSAIVPSRYLLISIAAAPTICPKFPESALFQSFAVRLWHSKRIVELGKPNCASATIRKLISCLYEVPHGSGRTERGNWKTISSGNAI